MLSEMAHYHLILTLTVLSLMRQYLFPISTSLLLAVNGSVIFHNYSYSLSTLSDYKDCMLCIAFTAKLVLHM